MTAVEFVERPFVHDKTIVIPKLGYVSFGDLAGGDVTEGVIDLIYVDMRRAQLVIAGLEARAQIRQGLADVIEWLHDRGVDA